MEERLEICKHCPIYDSKNQLCNGHLYLNPDNNDVTTSPKTGYIKGCSCYIPTKIKNPNKHCPAKKW